MLEKNKKEFNLTIGTNDTTTTKEDLIDTALKLEEYGNKELGMKFHIFEKEENKNES